MQIWLIIKDKHIKYSKKPCVLFLFELDDERKVVKTVID